VNRNAWASSFIDAIGAVHGDRNAWALVSWMQAEGGNAKWNPLNTTWDMHVAGQSNYNSTGVKNYPSFEVGLEASKKTILQTNPDYGFVAILRRLRNDAPAFKTLLAVEDSRWGTGGLALDCLPFVREDYWRYASHTIAGS